MKHFLVISLALVLCCCNRLPEKTSGTVIIGELSVHYEVQGEGSPIIFLHAGLQDCNMWKTQVEEISKQHRAIVLDLPTHGKTTGTDTTSRMADVLVEFMNALKIDKATFVGLSFGSVCAMDILLSHPQKVERVVLAAPGLLAWDKVVQMDSVSQPILAKLDTAFAHTDTLTQAKTFTEVWCDGPFRKEAEVNQEVREYIYTTTLENLRDHAQDYWPRFSNTDAALKVNTIKRPVLIVDSDHDLPLIRNVCTYLNNNITGSKRVTIAGPAHMLNMEASKEFNEHLLKFLSTK